MKYLFWSCVRQIEIRNYNQSSIFQISVCKTVSVLPLAIFESVVALTSDFVAVLSFLLWLVTYYLVWFLLAPSHLRATCVFLILLLSIQFIPFSVSFMGIYTNKFYWEQIESIYHICFKKTSFTSRFQKAWSKSLQAWTFYFWIQRKMCDSKSDGKLLFKVVLKFMTFFACSWKILYLVLTNDKFGYILLKVQIWKLDLGACWNSTLQIENKIT